jgi:hypothetical protein
MRTKCVTCGKADVSCATRRNDGMRGNLRGLYQRATEPLGLSRAGCSVPVSSMPLKGSGEARGKPPVCRAWLRDRMVSSNEAGLDLRGMPPLSQHLARWDSQWWGNSHTEVAQGHIATQRMTWVNLMYPMPAEEPRYAGIGLVDNRHRHDPAESITVNVGDLSGDVKESGSNELETALKSSDAPDRSQRGHSSRSTGKPCTGRRATAWKAGA